MKAKTVPILLLVVATFITGAIAVGQWPFGPWRRTAAVPILAPQGNGWESAGTFNPTVVEYNGKFVMLYRAQDLAGTSRLGYAESTDGIHFTRRAEPVLSPEADYEKDGGVEDPRLQKFGNTFYLTYTGYNRKDAQLCLATSLDLIHWERKGVILPAYKGNWNRSWTKSGAIVPEKIDGKYWMYWLGTADDNLVYRTAVGIFDRNDPRKILYRSDTPIFAPEKDWEKVGQVPNVIFVEGMVPQKDRWLFYYGGADKYVGVAEAPGKVRPMP